MRFEINTSPPMFSLLQLTMNEGGTFMVACKQILHQANTPMMSWKDTFQQKFDSSFHQLMKMFLWDQFTPVSIQIERGFIWIAHISFVIAQHVLCCSLDQWSSTRASKITLDRLLTPSGSWDTSINVHAVLWFTQRADFEISNTYECKLSKWILDLLMHE